MLSTKGKFKSIIGYIGENKYWSLPPPEKDQSCPPVTRRLAGRLESRYWVGIDIYIDSKPILGNTFLGSTHFVSLIIEISRRAASIPVAIKLHLLWRILWGTV